MEPTTTKDLIMAKLTLWRIQNTEDSESYSIIAKTMKDALDQLGSYPLKHEMILEKVVIEYASAFDLFDLVSGEGGGRHLYTNEITRYQITAHGHLIKTSKIK